MPTLLEMAQQIVMAHASVSHVPPNELVQEIQEVHAALQAIERGEGMPESGEGAAAPAVSKRKAFGKNQVTCLLCGKQMKTLGRHLRAEHGITPSDYRKRFDIPRTQPLASKSYSEVRRQMAIEKDLAAGLARARAARGKGVGAGPQKNSGRKARKTREEAAAE